MSPSSRDPILEVAGIDAGYGEAKVLTSVSLTVNAGRLVAVIGPNGAGKSTLLKAIYGLIGTTAGSVQFRAGGTMRDISTLRPYQLTRLGMNYVPQLANVFANISVLENLEVSIQRSWRQRHALIDEMFELFPLLAERRRQRAGTLSGGQRKLLALARALITKPQLLLLDEPSAGLAPSAMGEMFDILAHLRGEGQAILIVEQNAWRSLEIADYGFVLDMGRNALSGTGSSLLNNHKVIDLYLGGLSRESRDSLSL